MTSLKNLGSSGLFLTFAIKPVSCFAQHQQYLKSVPGTPGTATYLKWFVRLIYSSTENRYNQVSNVLIWTAKIILQCWKRKQEFIPWISLLNFDLTWLFFNFLWVLFAYLFFHYIEADIRNVFNFFISRSIRRIQYTKVFKYFSLKQMKMFGMFVFHLLSKSNTL